jgi:hypothetical protein
MHFLDQADLGEICAIAGGVRQSADRHRSSHDLAIALPDLEGNSAW